MNGEYLLDTNIVIALFSDELAIREKLEQENRVFIPSQVLGELYYGAFNSSRRNTNLERIDQFRSEMTILSSDEDTARYYGQIKSQLKKAGRPIPENDIWIASLAIQHQLTLVSRDGHFRHIEGIKLEIW